MWSKAKTGLFNPQSREEQACFYILQRKNSRRLSQKRVELAFSFIQTWKINCGRYCGHGHYWRGRLTEKVWKTAKNKRKKHRKRLFSMLFLVWVTRLELAASTTPNWKKLEIFPVIVDYFTLSSAILRYCALFEWYRRAWKMYIWCIVLPCMHQNYVSKNYVLHVFVMLRILIL